MANSIIFAEELDIINQDDLSIYAFRNTPIRKSEIFIYLIYIIISYNQIKKI